ncbi:hypothetical protein EYF80_012366 [Liparis tanakae]|uniref:Uncharacterized protein n=1 Tax=Liparis tanakae TaxID=230148 RepID=A0A4Z2IJH3_9TELE|nr:hypothetical protein EYF80_012366 [Liparis tanakae]
MDTQPPRGAALQQQFDNGGMSVPHSVVERRVVLVARCIQQGSPGEQHLHNHQVPKRCPPSMILQVGVSPLVQQLLHSLYIPLQDPRRTNGSPRWAVQQMQAENKEIVYQQRLAQRGRLLALVRSF